MSSTLWLRSENFLLGISLPERAHPAIFVDFYKFIVKIHHHGAVKSENYQNYRFSQQGGSNYNRTIFRSYVFSIKY